MVYPTPWHNPAIGVSMHGHYSTRARLAQINGVLYNAVVRKTTSEGMPK